MNGASNLTPFSFFLALLTHAAVAHGAPAKTAQPTYTALTDAIVAAQQEYSGSAPRQLEQRLLAYFDQLTGHWLGSRWGMGHPQSTTPHAGKTNCGLFVAVVLRDLGFDLPIWKFNRQASSDMIRSLVPPREIHTYRRLSRTRFLKKVRALGPGLFIVGLDYHVGFLRQTAADLRFVHSSFYEEKVVNQAAADAPDFSHNRLFVVGRLLGPQMLTQWQNRTPIKVKGGR